MMKIKYLNSYTLAIYTNAQLEALAIINERTGTIIALKNDDVKALRRILNRNYIDNSLSYWIKDYRKGLVK